MEKPNDINYICARWRDAITDPPPEGWMGLVIDGNAVYAVKFLRGTWHEGGWSFFARPNQRWLDVTTIPAVPREAVQKAILEMRGDPPWGCDTWQAAEDILIKHTGVTPTEPTP